VPDFSEMARKAKEFVGSHDKESDEALDKAADFVNERTGGSHESQVQSGERKLEDYLGVEDQDQK
jgi:MT0933-like antitoxin protein